MTAPSPKDLILAVLDVLLVGVAGVLAAAVLILVGLLFALNYVSGWLRDAVRGLRWV